MELVKVPQNQVAKFMFRCQTFLFQVMNWPTSIQIKLYGKEVATLAMLGTYKGIGQIFADVSILKVPVVSVYSENGNPTNR